MLRENAPRRRFGRTNERRFPVVSRCSHRRGERQCWHARGGDGGAVALAPSQRPPEPRGDGAFAEGHDGPGDEGRRLGVEGTRDARPFPAQRPVRRGGRDGVHPSRRVARPRGRVALRESRGGRETGVGLVPPRTRGRDRGGRVPETSGEGVSWSGRRVGHRGRGRFHRTRPRRAQRRAPRASAFRARRVFWVRRRERAVLDPHRGAVRHRAAVRGSVPDRRGRVAGRKRPGVGDERRVAARDGNETDMHRRASVVGDARLGEAGERGRSRVFLSPDRARTFRGRDD